MPMPTTKFERQLRGLARAANRDLLPESYELYDLLVLEPYGDDAASAALLAWMSSNQNASFPTPGQLLAQLQPQSSAKAMAAERATRLMAAISRRGYTWVETYRYDGHTAWRDASIAEFGEATTKWIEDSGGWVEVCRQFGGDEPTSTARAQIRDALETVIAREQSQQLRGTKKPVHEIAQKREGDLVPIGDPKFYTARFVRAVNSGGAL